MNTGLFATALSTWKDLYRHSIIMKEEGGGGGEGGGGEEEQQQ